MNGKWLESLMARRSFLARLGAGAGAVGAMATRSSAAGEQAAGDAPWRPARHAQDDWLEKIPSQHRLVFDNTTPEGVSLALRFARNYFRTNEGAYGLKDNDLTVVMVVRHHATSLGYADAMWAKYGKQLSEQSGFTDPKTKEPPKINLYAVASESSDPEDPAGAMDMLLKKGVIFAVCATASRGIAGRIAKATGGDPDAILKEIGANLISNARLVPAGIVAVNRAQERGYSFVSPG